MKNISVEISYVKMFPDDLAYQLLTYPKIIEGEEINDFINSVKILGNINNPRELLTRLKMYLYNSHCVVLPNNELKSRMLFNRKSVTVSFTHIEPRKRVANVEYNEKTRSKS